MLWNSALNDHSFPLTATGYANKASPISTDFGEQVEINLECWHTSREDVPNNDTNIDVVNDVARTKDRGCIP